ncbi:hypothetical protein H5410_031581 [Solanum commersonii]|uniref:MBD domain-containing protein n=1 Tax=Solanum commersonii TaxID=4109 RepID=A0A9J5YHK6_SOLCO|nr:hypothetical protein H5410_031581 [Solanum commersonii]
MSSIEKITPIHRVNKSLERNVERQRWLPKSWTFLTIVHTSSATIGMVDKYYYEPITESRF